MPTRIVSPNEMTRQRKGKAWIEFLCNQLGVNAFQLRDAIKKAKPSSGSKAINVHFVEDYKRPGEGIQLDIKKGAEWLHNKNFTSVQWDDAVHGYEVFESGGVPIAGPLPLNVRVTDHAAATEKYEGTYLMLRLNADHAVVAELLKLGHANFASADFSAHLKLREASGGRDWARFSGFGHSTAAAIWGYGVRRHENDDHECLSFSLARHDDGSPDYLAGMVLRRPRRGIEPIAHQVLLRRVVTRGVGELDLLRECQEHLEKLKPDLELGTLQAKTAGKISEAIAKLRVAGFLDFLDRQR